MREQCVILDERKLSQARSAAAALSLGLAHKRELCGMGQCCSCVADGQAGTPNNLQVLGNQQQVSKPFATC